MGSSVTLSGLWGTNRRAEGVGSGETQVDEKRRRRREGAQHLRTTPLCTQISPLIFAPDLPESVLDWTGSGEGVGRGFTVNLGSDHWVEKGPCSGYGEDRGGGKWCVSRQTRQ